MCYFGQALPLALDLYSCLPAWSRSSGPHWGNQIDEVEICIVDEDVTTVRTRPLRKPRSLNDSPRCARFGPPSIRKPHPRRGGARVPRMTEMDLRTHGSHALWVRPSILRNVSCLHLGRGTLAGGGGDCAERARLPSQWPNIPWPLQPPPL